MAARKVFLVRARRRTGRPLPILARGLTRPVKVFSATSTNNWNWSAVFARSAQEWAMLSNTDRCWGSWTFCARCVHSRARFRIVSGLMVFPPRTDPSETLRQKLFHRTGNKVRGGDGVWYDDGDIHRLSALHCRPDSEPRALVGHTMPLAGELSRIGAGTQGSADRGSTARAVACVDLVLSNELRSEIRCLEIGACDGDHRLCACIKLWTGPNRPA